MDLSTRKTEVKNNEEKVKATEEVDALAKYNSLIHILKDHEEFTLNSKGIIISSNLEVVNITGYEECEVIGKSIDLFYSECEKEKAIFDLDKAARLKQCVVTGIKQKKRGTEFWAKMKITAMFDEKSEVCGYKVVLQDATHRALSNARIRTLKDEYLAIFNNPFVGSFKFRMQDFRIQMCNHKTLEIIGKTNSVGLSFDSFFNSQQQFDHFISLLTKEKRVDGFKFLVKDDNNADNWAVISARYFEGKGFAEGVLFDISEQHIQMTELLRVNTELDNFIYHASHDLRAPLTTIMGLINLAKLETEQAHDYIEKIESRVMRLDSLLKDLVSISHNNKTEIACTEFNFKQEVDLIIKEYLDPDQQAVVKVDIDHGLPYFTDQTRLRTILRNLISNAFKYRKLDADNHSITLKVKVEPTHADVQIQDNGIGIEWNLKDRVWDMFFRASTQSTGSGLGLYIVKSMVEKLRGKIALESTPSDGTTFLLAIPNLVPGSQPNFNYHLSTQLGTQVELENRHPSLKVKDQLRS